jgi:hypothetical protein
MSTLENKRLELELIKVKAAKAELEFKIEEKLDEIERIKSHIESQIKREQELTKLINK